MCSDPHLELLVLGALPTGDRDGSRRAGCPVGAVPSLCRKRVGRQISHVRLQVLDFQVGVALSGRDPGVAQQLLHRPEIGPGAQGVGGEGVAQHGAPPP